MKQTTLDEIGKGKEKRKEAEKIKKENGKKVEYYVYEAKRILNKYKHADYWFWNRYSAHPYTGCEHACEYCYARADKYLHTDTPDDFSRVIRVKRNAADLLRKELPRVKKDVLMTGDYQPAERKFGLSRKVLEVVRDNGFPVHAAEKSDLILKDLDVLSEINERSWACVSFSFSTVNEDISRVFEPVAPPPERRLRAMKKIAESGILTGANLMPVLPFITDSEDSMEEVIKKVRDHNGKFVLIGGLTLDDNVRVRYFNLLRKQFPELLPKCEELYSSDVHGYYTRISQLAIKIVRKYGLRDRIPRYCQNFNQRVAEKLFDKVYRIEMEDPKKAWVYRKAAWYIDELDRDIREIEDLKTLPGIGEKMAALIREIFEELH